MKKLILLFLLFYSFAYSQVDTANYNFNVDLLTGKYTSIISKSPVFGAQGFKYLVQELQATSIDTTQFQYVGNIDGKYTIIENVVSYYGKDSGTVQMQLFNAPTSSSSFDSSLFVKRSAFSQSIEATGGDFEITSITGALLFNGYKFGFNMNRPPAVFTINQIDSNTGIRLYKNNDGSGDLTTLYSDIWTSSIGNLQTNSTGGFFNVNDTLTANKLTIGTTTSIAKVDVVADTAFSFTSPRNPNSNGTWAQKILMSNFRLRFTPVTGKPLLTLSGNDSTMWWRVDTTGSMYSRALLSMSDGTYDIGAAAASRFRNLYLTGDNTIGASGEFIWNTRTRLQSPANGTMILYNNARTGFTSLLFGGSTSSFGGIFPSGSTLEFKLADNSAYAPIKSLSLTTDTPKSGTAGTWKLGIYKTDGVGLTPSTTNYIQVDIGGTLYKLAVVN